MKGGIIPPAYYIYLPDEGRYNNSHPLYIRYTSLVKGGIISPCYQIYLLDEGRYYLFLPLYTPPWWRKGIIHPSHYIYLLDDCGIIPLSHYIIPPCWREVLSLPCFILSIVPSAAGCMASGGDHLPEGDPAAALRRLKTDQDSTWNGWEATDAKPPSLS